MKIQGTLAGDMIGFALKYNQENGTRFAYVKQAVAVTREECRALFGSEVERTAFSSMIISTGAEGEGAAGVRFGYKELTPAAVCEFSKVTMGGHTRSLQPVIKKITPVKDAEKVTIQVEFPILVKSDTKLIGDLAILFGETIKIEVNPAQVEMDLDGEAPNKEAGVVIKTGAFGNPEAIQTGQA